MPLEKIKLVARALNKIDRHCDGALVATYISNEDYEASGATDEMTEGIIDHLRSVEGGLIAAVVRDQGSRGRTARKVSLRSMAGEADVSAIARSQGGGGHVRAAGFSTDLAYEDVISLLCEEIGSQAKS